MKTFGQTMREIQAATHGARERTGDKAIGTCATKGRLHVVRVTYPGGRATSKVEYLTEALPIPDAIAYLNAYGLTETT